jgi:large subunit ribosomal protein L29
VKIRDLREKTDEELRDQLNTLRQGLFNLRFRSATDRVENTAEFSKTRRDIARIETLLNERCRAKAATSKPVAAKP